MTTAPDALPLLGLRIVAGPLELRGITDDLIGPLADLAVEGIHDPDAMPIYVPWSTAPTEVLPTNFAKFHWSQRASFSPAKWTMDLAAFHEGELAGTQGFGTSDYLVTRTGETGSWLGRRFQGRGIGTLMRQVVCAFVFDHLGATEVTSGAFTDNPASLAVSRKVGYRLSGTRRVQRRSGEMAVVQGLTLAPDDLVRAPYDLEVEGLEPFRRSVGL